MTTFYSFRPFFMFWNNFRVERICLKNVAKKIRRELFILGDIPIPIARLPKSMTIIVVSRWHEEARFLLKNDLL